MRASGIRTINRGSMLQQYTAQYGASMSKHRSTIALRAARIEAELAYRARGTFLANMNHELRTPLNAIVGFAGMLKQAGEFGIDEATQQEYLDYILQSSELLLGHIDTLLELAAAESGGAKMRRRDTVVSEIMDEVIEKMQPMAAAAGVNLVVHIDDVLPEIFVDPEKIVKAMNHLIENAVAYVEEAGTVTLQVRAGTKNTYGNAEWVYFSVEDNGIGMTREELGRALKTFEQVSGGLDRRFEGAGIGLPVAKSFIELNNGKFNVKSVKGTGTAVRFALPAAKITQNVTEIADTVVSEPNFKQAG